MRERAIGAVWLFVALASFGLGFHHVRALEATFPPSDFQTKPTSAGTSILDGFTVEARYASSGATPSVHSATAVEIQGGKILALWYGGSREGGEDVAIFDAVFDPETGRWSGEERVTTREETSADLGRYVKKLGNPVVARDARGRLWLFYVSVSMGGWSGSAINYRISEDEGSTWGQASRLVTSPFLNLSTLVRGPALLCRDGTLLLPVYHELLGKFGELLRISPGGEVLDKVRLSRGRSSLQPVVVPLGARDALAFLRRSGSSPARILAAETRDAGRDWSEIHPTPLPNPDAAVAALALGDAGPLLVAFNDSETDRSNLTFAASMDRGRSFRAVHVLDPPRAEPGAELSYPWLLASSTGDLHLLYSWNRSRIVHVRLRPPAADGSPR
jgi:predicted neuraminidase